MTYTAPDNAQPDQPGYGSPARAEGEMRAYTPMPKGVPAWADELAKNLDFLEAEIRLLDQALEPIKQDSAPTRGDEEDPEDPDGTRTVALLSPIAGQLAARSATIRKLTLRLQQLRYRLDLPDVEKPF